MEDRGWRDQGSRIHSAFLLQSFRRGHLQAAWQIRSKHPPDLHARLRLWKQHCSCHWLSDPGQATRTQQPSRCGADGACQSGTNHPGKSRVPQAPKQHPQAATLLSVPDPNPSRGARGTWAELILPRKKPKAEEKVKAKSPLAASLVPWPCCCLSSALCWVLHRAEEELPKPSCP